MKKMRKIAVLLCLVSVLAIQGIHTSSAKAIDRAFNVLVLNSYHIGYSWGESVLKGIRNELEVSNLPLNVHYEFMDTKQHSPNEIFSPLYRLYERKYKNAKFDIIIASDNNALNFLVKYRETLFPDTPVAFCGVTRFSQDLLQGKSGFTGVAEHVDIAETIKLAQLLFPRTQNIALVSGGVTTSSKNNLQHARDVKPQFAGQLNFIELTKLNPQDLKNKLAQLPKHTVILYLSYYRTPDGTILNVKDSTSLVANSSGLPVFSPWQYTLGHGVLGGKMLSGEQQGENAAQLALKVLKGTPVADLPVIHKQQNKYIFDYRQLKQFSISREILPHSAQILFEPQTLFYKYKSIILIATASFAWLALTIIVLLWMLKEKNKTAKLLKREEERLESLLALNDQADTSLELLVQFGLERIRHLLRATTAVYFNVNADNSIDKYCTCTIQKTIWQNVTTPVQTSTLPEPWRTVLEQKKVCRLQPNQRNTQPWPLDVGQFKNSIALPIWEAEKLQALIILGDEEISFSSSDERQLTLLMQGVMNLIQKRRAREREKQLASELRHSQKMEALGTVAGGIAHDFNNIIGAISSCCELALDDVPKDNPAHEDIKQALKAAYRGKQIIGRIRTFSCRSEATAEPIHFPSLVEECIELLQTLLPSTIDLNLSINSSGSGTVIADAGELHQIIMNLCLNADHAMFGMHGTLSVSVNEITITSGATKVPHDLQEGQYLCLAVSDTGIGMNADILPRIFDPFFTTKKEKGGTGLGLSTVHGISKKYGGTVSVESLPEKGTTFYVYLPMVTDSSSAEVIDHETMELQGTENILLVDDDKEILYSVHKFLTKQGYTVSASTSSADAFDRIQQNPMQYDLLLADQIMPELTGLELAKAAIKVKSDIPVVIYSGFEGEDVTLFTQQAAEVGIAAFVPKPFRNSELGSVIRNALDTRQERQHGSNSHN